MQQPVDNESETRGTKRRFLPFAMSLAVLVQSLIQFGSYQSRGNIANYSTPFSGHDAWFFHPEGWPFVNWFVAYQHPDSIYQELFFIEWQGIAANLFLAIASTAATFVFFTRLHTLRNRFQFSIQNYCAFVLFLCVLMTVLSRYDAIERKILPMLGLMRSEYPSSLSAFLLASVGFACLGLVGTNEMVKIVFTRIGSNDQAAPLDNKALNRSVHYARVGQSSDGRNLPLYPTTSFTNSNLIDASVNAGVIPPGVQCVDIIVKCRFHAREMRPLQQNCTAALIDGGQLQQALANGESTVK